MSDNLYTSFQIVDSLFISSDVSKRFPQVISIDELHPFTQYNLSFAFEYGRFSGPLTQTVVTTKEGVPSPPRIKSGFSTNHSITFHWSESDDPKGIVIGYVVELYRCGASESAEPKESMRLHKQQIGTIQREHTFENLDANACYAVRVAAGTQVGFGVFSRILQVQTDLPSPKPPDLLSVNFLDTNDILLNWTCAGACSSSVGKIDYTVCWTFLPITAEPKCLSTQTINANHQVFCNCGNGQYQTTVMPWSIMQHARSTQAAFTVRSVLRRPSCPNSGSCEKLSPDSNRVVLDLSNAPLYGRLKSLPVPGFKLDSTAIGGIVAISLLILFAVTSVACFASRLGCMFALCRSSLLYRRSLENPTKYRRIVPLRLNKVNYQPIARASLRAYVSSAHSNDDAVFQAEFEDIEQSVPTDWTAHVARLPENVNRNRYSNVLAYDHTRVTLREVGHKSDYINANYVDGYHRRSAYIATQGPTPSTFDDFWLMAWEQGCNVIVMISNFIERGRRKCDKYWPSSGQQTYGNISVRMISETVRAFFTIRVFLIRHVRCKRNPKDRLVYHYQYTDWRDFDVPPSPLPVLKFVEASISHWSLDKGPIIVHCSAGVGRTGTYICIESLIRQLQAEHVVSIRGFLEHIRQQRMKLVQTEQQYAFIHDALREYVLYPCHTIRVPHFRDYLHHLRELDSSGRSNLEKQFDMCIESYGDSADMSRSRTLSTVSRRGTADVLGINSSALHGYHMLSEYIVARHPLAGTETEFWKMVWDENSSIIVCLSGPELPLFWPNKPNEVRTIGWLHVSYAGSTAYRERLTRYEFLLTSDREDYALACTLWRFDGWPSVELETESELSMADTLLELITHVVEEDEDDGEDGDGDDRDDGYHRSTGPIVVVDNAGGNRVGTFCALRILINQLTHENLLDVYFVFKMLCFQRPRMFQSHRDLEFVYSLLEHCLSREPSLMENIHNSHCHGQHSSNSGHAITTGSSGHGTITSILGLGSPTRREPHLHPRRRTKIALHNRFSSKSRGRHINSVGATNCNGSALFGLHSRNLMDGLEEVSLLPPGPDVPAEDCLSRPPSPHTVMVASGSTQETLTPTVNGDVGAVSNSASVQTIEAGRHGSAMDNLTHSWSDVSAGTHGQGLTFPNSKPQDRTSLRHSVHSFPSTVDL
ncbi:putative receptor protein tyrosine phosphatase [Fasciola gigantica]|uniref:protein-tyrosine-phosphatase n=1 Tax=Fasciola gigantica TaxID=46835 RepID=A0A504YQP8_FASGI|nr:putative receptor protein tyrosine phosphatase [Fasciola gigantica]